MSDGHTTVWHGCYDSGWQWLIVPEAFAHPAKFARGLIERIVGYLLSGGRLQRGDTVVDPFGGVGLGGVICASNGIRWLGCELEPRFVGLAEQNFALHRRTWEAVGDPLPRIVQGDSREMCKVLGPALAEAVIGSPPFEDNLQSGSPESKWKLMQQCMRDGNGHTSSKLPPGVGVDYGSTPGQLGAVAGQTFWQASRLIVEQCYAILKPRGIAVFVTKDFVRNKARVPFSDDWRKLCEACGFRLVEWVKASLVKEVAAPNLFGGPQSREKKKCSFFRRLAEKKGSPNIDWEDVLIMERSE